MKKTPKRTVVLAAAQDGQALKAVISAHNEGQINYILVGPKEKTQEAARQESLEADPGNIIEASTDEACAELAVELVKSSPGRILMKGGLATATLLKAVVRKDSGVRCGGLLSHLALVESPHYHKLLAVTDGAMVPSPDFEQKRAIAQNAIDFFCRLGYTDPKIAFLAAVEMVNPQMPETVEAELLAAHFNRLGKGMAAGPLSLDLAISRDSAGIKKAAGPVVADADILIAPNIAAGNILTKGMLYFGGALMAGLILGARVPIVLTSRAAAAKEKYLSLLIAAGACK